MITMTEDDVNRAVGVAPPVGAEPPADAAPLAEVARELEIPEPTLRYWTNKGWVRYWVKRGRWRWVSRSEAQRFNGFTPGTSGPLTPPGDESTS